MKTVQSMLAEAQAAVPMISPQEAQALVGKADVLFLDVREPPEVAASAVPSRQERGTPPLTVQSTPVPAQTMHLSRPRRDAAHPC